VGDYTPNDSALDERLPPAVKSAIAIMLVATFVVILNETIMGVALPRLMTDLDISAATAQWLTTAYLLTMAVVIPISGRILETFSTRSVFVSAMGLFSVGTITAAAAPGFPVLLFGRIVQASGTALMLPLLMTTVLTFVPESRRGRTMGLISIVIAVAPAIGPTVSGVILDVLNWRWIFILVAPIAILALVLGLMLVQNVSSTRRVYFDAVSIVLAAVGFGGLIFGLSSIGESSEAGSHLVSPLVPIAIGVLALGLFVWRQVAMQPYDKALLSMLPFRTPSFSVALLLVVIVMLMLFGTLILLPLYIQNVLGLDALQTGLMLLPGGLAMGAAAPFVGRLFDRFGPRPLLIPGSILLSATLWMFTTLGVESSAATVIALHVALSISLAIMLTPLLTSALGSLPRDLYSHGSALVNTLQQVAGAAGTALFVTLLSVGSATAESAGRALEVAQADGVHLAFTCGAFISLLAVAVSPFIRRSQSGGPRPIAH
jgi:MFS transporter, DHA2 family, lincomycin resistance protein